MKKTTSTVSLAALSLATSVLVSACSSAAEADAFDESSSAVSATPAAKLDWFPATVNGGLAFTGDAASSKLRNCPAGDPMRASLAIFHQGGNGAMPLPDNTAWPPSAAKTEALENATGTLHQIRAYLRTICVRLVVVGTYADPAAWDAGYFAGQPTQKRADETWGDFARRRQAFAADRLRRGIDFVFSKFPSAPSYTYLGGSMSSVLGASMVNDGWTREALDPAIARLRRVIVSGVTAGNYMLADAHSVPAPTATSCPPPPGQSAGFSCAVAGAPYVALRDAPVSDGNLYPPGKGLHRFLAAGGKLNMFSGTDDAIFGHPSAGAWSGPEGVANFQEQAHIACGHVDCSDDANAEGSVDVTNANLAGATHVDTWTYPKPETATPSGTDNVPHYICRRIAYDLFPNASQALRTGVCSRPIR